MGKATEVVDDLATRPLSADELRRQQAARELAGADVRATLDGRLVKQDDPTEAPREVVQVPTSTWD